MILMLKFMIPALALIAMPAAAETVRVKGHVNKNGVYVAPHARTAPDSRVTNNWSSKPNVNPYTGKAGTVDPYKPYTPKTYKPRKY
jgi:hypothetical protein